MASSILLWAIPTAIEPTNGLARSSVSMAILNPCPTFPSIFSTGTCTSSNTTSHVLEPRIPILFSSCPAVIPGVSALTINAVNPLCPRERSTVAKTTKMSATPALVIKHFLPLIMYSSPTSFAVVLPEATSEPASGSVRANAPQPPGQMTSAYIFFCASVPYRSTGFNERPVAAMLTAKPASALASSS